MTYLIVITRTDFFHMPDILSKTNRPISFCRVLYPFPFSTLSSAHAHDVTTLDIARRKNVVPPGPRSLHPLDTLTIMWVARISRIASVVRHKYLVVAAG